MTILDLQRAEIVHLRQQLRTEQARSTTLRRLLVEAERFAGTAEQEAQRAKVRASKQKARAELWRVRALRRAA